MPRPIDDTTQNANLKGEYAGSTPWGKPFNVSLGGGLSRYSDSFNSLTFQNPWNVDTVSPALQGLRPVNNLYSLPPDNQAANVSVQGGVGLPFNSRYMGTFQYTKMTADQSNLPFSINPGVLALGTQFSAPSRETNTLLFNNVLHTQLTSDLQSTLKYRYYSYKPEQNPAIIFGSRPPNPDSTLGFPDEEGAIRFPVEWTKQNADAQIDYRPWKWLNVGASYDWERWDYTNRQVNDTNENSGKIFLDSKWGFSTLRASLLYGQRRYDNYFQLPDTIQNPTINADGFRYKDLANRNRTKGVLMWAVDVTNMITITPNGGFLIDDYQTDVNFTPTSQFGLKKVSSWNAGADATVNVTRDMAFFVSYNYENGYRQVYENASPPNGQRRND